ncbi:MAG: histidinol-phosphatase HisJ family protein [Oscillospiraceae bacterium]
MSLNYIDCHTHTSFSPDAKSSPLEMCNRAKELGLAAYAVTDHCDVNYWDNAEDESIVDYDMYGSGEYALKSIETVSKLKDDFPNLLCGIELGQPMQNISKAEIIADDSRLDFIIGSHHMNKGEYDFYYLKYDEMNAVQIDALLENYFTQVLEMVKWNKFDILGHLTYPLRYIEGNSGINIDMAKYEDIIRLIFKTLIQNGKGIEINTSGLRQKYGKTFPDLKYVKMFHSLGGEIVSVGSDSHCAEDLGKGIAEGIELAGQAGFKYITYFKNRKPRMLKI